MKQLGEIADVIRGIAFPKEARTNTHEDGLVACLRTTNVQKTVEWGDLWFVPHKYVKNEKQYLLAGDTLISTANSLELVGKVAHLHTLEQRATLGAFIAAIRPSAAVAPKYLYLALAAPSSQEQIRGTASTTTNISNISVKKLLAMELPLPPLPTQHRIVAEIEEKLSRLDAAQSALLRAQANLKRYRASALKQTYGLNHNSSELPEGWEWTTIGKQFRVEVGATPSRKDATYWNGEIPWVSSGEVQFCRVHETTETITQLGYQNSSTKLNPVGSVLLAMIGQGKTRGQAAILEIEAANNQNCAAIWVGKTQTPPEFVYYWFMLQYDETRRIGSGNNQQALNKSLVQALALPWPPLATQKKIVEEVERRLSVIDRTEQTLRTQLERAKRLRQSILQQAFSPTNGAEHA